MRRREEENQGDGTRGQLLYSKATEEYNRKWSKSKKQPPNPNPNPLTEGQ
jgi:hypothetical protein